ncbi:MAG: SUMF1/EgtB/PvdO family nonheme iron enzyme [Planctomycetota bacterium]
MRSATRDAGRASALVAGAATVSGVVGSEDRDRAPPPLFLSYRRDEEQRLPQNLKRSLDLKLGGVFLDVDSIRTGEKWEERIEGALRESVAVLVVVSRHWLMAHDEWGRRRIDDPRDWCHRELALALELELPLFPILDGGPMPPAEAFPRPLRGLAAVQGIEWNDNDWGTSLATLVQALSDHPKLSLVLGEPRPVPTERPRPDVLEAYGRHLAAVHNQLAWLLPGAESHQLTDVYVEVAVGVAEARPVAGAAAPERLPSRTFAARSLALEALLDAPPAETGGWAWVVLGDPGAGKSTVARHVAQKRGQALQRAIADGTPAGAVPVLLPLSELGSGDRHPFAAAEDVLGGHQQDGDAAGLAERLFAIARGAAPGCVWLLLDGLDEVAPERMRGLCQTIQAWARDLGPEHVRIVVFSRVLGYVPIGGPFQSVRLRPLERPQRRDLLRRWLGEAQAEALADRLERQPEVVPLMGNPLLLTLLARLWREREFVPEDRTRLYREAVDLLLRTPWRDPEPIRAPEDALHVLGDLSLTLEEDAASAWSIEILNRALWDSRERSKHTDRVLQSVWGGNNEQFLRDVERRTGLLASDPATGKSWGFLHRQFREFLAAHALARGDRPWTEVVGELNQKSLPRWSETLGLYCGLVADPWEVLHELKDKDAGATIRALAEVDGPPAAALFAFVWDVLCKIEGWTWSEEQRSRFYWDGDDLVRLVQAWVRRGRWTADEARAALWARVRTDAPTWELAWLHFALRDLGELDEAKFFATAGRPMPAVAPDWVRLEGGTFEMGSPIAEPERLESEGPQHEVRVAGFALQRGAVTNAEYARFDGAHEAEAFGGRVADPSRHPVVNVGWWEAYVYSAWVGGRLPSEAEWEYACRAGTTGPFSFDRELTTELVNYDGDGPYAGGPKGEDRGSTVAVGTLPANPWGLVEMHGNVWEWCQDRWHDDYRGAPGSGAAWELGGSAGRVLRGGSWIYGGGDCRSACRGGDAAGGPRQLRRVPPRQVQLSHSHPFTLSAATARDRRLAQRVGTCRRPRWRERRRRRRQPAAAVVPARRLEPSAPLPKSERQEARPCGLRPLALARGVPPDEMLRRGPRGGSSRGAAPPSVESGVRACWDELAGRNPTLLSRLPAAFLLRHAERQFLPLLIQEPPRSTRFAEPMP